MSRPPPQLLDEAAAAGSWGLPAGASQSCLRCWPRRGGASALGGLDCRRGLGLRAARRRRPQSCLAATREDELPAGLFGLHFPPAQFRARGASPGSATPGPTPVWPVPPAPNPPPARPRLCPWEAPRNSGCRKPALTQCGTVARLSQEAAHQVLLSQRGQKRLQPRAGRNANHPREGLPEPAALARPRDPAQRAGGLEENTSCSKPPCEPGPEEAPLSPLSR